MDTLGPGILSFIRGSTVYSGFQLHQAFHSSQASGKIGISVVEPQNNGHLGYALIVLPVNMWDLKVHHLE